MAIFRFFQDGGRPPSWICDEHVWTTHEGHLVIFITIDREFEFYEFFSFLKFNEFYELFFG